MLFDQQANWAFVPKPLDALEQMMRQAGFSKEKFEATLKDQTLYDAVNAVKEKALSRVGREGERERGRADFGLVRLSNYCRGGAALQRSAGGMLAAVLRCTYNG